MGNILFFVQNTVSVDGQNSSSKFTVRVKVRADLQAAATEQTLSRLIDIPPFRLLGVGERSSGAAGSAAVLRKIIPSKI